MVAAMAYCIGPKLYTMGLPNGGRMVVNRPKYQLPKSVRTIPDKFNKRFGRVGRRMRVESYKSDLTAKPWRPQKYRRQPSRKRDRIPRSRR